MANFKKCIACAELIKPNALRCRHCETSQDDAEFLLERAPEQLIEALHEDSESGMAPATSAENKFNSYTWVGWTIFAGIAVFAATAAIQSNSNFATSPSSIDRNGCTTYLATDMAAVFGEFDTTTWEGFNAGLRKWEGLLNGWFSDTENEDLRRVYNAYTFALHEAVNADPSDSSQAENDFATAQANLNAVCATLADQ